MRGAGRRSRWACFATKSHQIGTRTLSTIRGPPESWGPTVDPRFGMGAGCPPFRLGRRPPHRAPKGMALGRTTLPRRRRGKSPHSGQAAVHNPPPPPIPHPAAYPDPTSLALNPTHHSTTLDRPSVKHPRPQTLTPHLNSYCPLHTRKSATIMPVVADKKGADEELKARLDSGMSGATRG